MKAIYVSPVFDLIPMSSLGDNNFTVSWKKEKNVLMRVVEKELEMAKRLGFEGK